MKTIHLSDWRISLEEDRPQSKKQSDLARSQLATLRNNSSEAWHYCNAPNQRSQTLVEMLLIKNNVKTPSRKKRPRFPAWQRRVMTECSWNGLTNILLHDIQPPLSLGSTVTAEPTIWFRWFSFFLRLIYKTIVTSCGPACSPVLQTVKQNKKNKKKIEHQIKIDTDRKKVVW